MKRNVDLTENRMFSEARGIREIVDLFNDSIKFLWNCSLKEITSDEELYNQSEEIILTGSHKDRERKIFNCQYGGGYLCDCCGLDLNIKPWNKYFSLCDRCGNDMDYSIQKLWRFNSLLPQDETEDRVVIEMNKNSR